MMITLIETYRAIEVPVALANISSNDADRPMM